MFHHMYFLDLIQNHTFVANRVAVRATGTKLPRFCMEPRSGSNGTIPRPKTRYFEKNMYTFCLAWVSEAEVATIQCHWMALGVAVGQPSSGCVALVVQTPR